MSNDATDNRRIWNNYILEYRSAYGHAARRNRGRFTGAKIHALFCEYVVGLVDPSIPCKPGTAGHTFRTTGEPVLFTVFPVCGCTQGQHAGSPIKGATKDDVTCTRCKA